MIIHDIAVASNLLITMAAIWGASWLYARYCTVKNDLYRFKLYALRDKLSMLVMKGEVIEASPEHATLLHLINNAILSTETFEITHFFRFVVEFSSNEGIRTNIEEIRSRMEVATNTEYKVILRAFFDVVGKKLYENLLLPRLIVRVIGLFDFSTVKLHFVAVVRKKKEELENAYHYIDGVQLKLA